MEEKTHSRKVEGKQLRVSEEGKQSGSSEDDEYEVVYEVVYETDSDESDGQNSSDEEVEVEYVTEIVDEKGNVIREEPTPPEEIRPRPDPVKIVVKPPSSDDPPLPKPILMRTPSTLKKSVSFSSVHSVLTETNDVIFVDEDDDIFK